MSEDWKRRNELVQVPGVLLLRESKNALGITTDTRPYADTEFKRQGRPKPVEVWVAKSCMGETDLKNSGDIGFIFMPRWLADKNELVHFGNY